MLVSVGPDGVLLVDDEFSTFTRELVEAIEAIDPTPIRYVLNTHWHPDHTGGNKALGKQAIIFAHHNVKERLARPQHIAAFGQRVAALPPHAWPDVTFGTDMILRLNGETITLTHVPAAHTDSDALVYFEKANVLHVGDLFFPDSFPHIDLDGGGTLKGTRAAVDVILAHANPTTRIVPGHGTLATRKDVLLFKEMLIESERTVEQGISTGLNLEGIVAQGLPARWNGWGDDFVSTRQWLSTLHRALTRGATQ